MIAISGGFVLVAVAVAGFRLLTLAHSSTKRLKQASELVQIRKDERL